MSKRHIAFIHGFLEDATMWQTMMGHLTKKDFIIHTPEIPGHGKNKSLPAEHTVESYAKNIFDQINPLDGEKVFLIGHSMGGYISASIAAMWPDKVSGLCFFHSKAGADTDQKKQDRLRAIEAINNNKSLYVRTMINSLFSPKKSEVLRDAIEQQIATASELDAEVMVAAHRVMMNRTDRVPEMKHRHFPLYYFLGDSDPSLPKELLEQELAQLPGAVAHFASDTGHMGHLECNAEAGAFLQRILHASH